MFLYSAITSNIKYFLKDILKLYNGKEFTYNNDTYFIYDTLITKDFHKPDKEALDTSDKSEKSDTNVPFYSIYQKQTHFHSNLKTHKIVVSKSAFIGSKYDPYDSDN